MNDVGESKMALRKMILSTTCLALLSAPVFAGWDQKLLDDQINSQEHIQTQLERLERENEQLRNAIAQMRKQKNSAAVPLKPEPTNDSRIQALIEENKRLTKQLDQSKAHQTTLTDGIVMRKINALDSQNENLRNKIKNLKAEKRALKLQNEKNHSKEGASLKSRIQDLEKQNKALIAEKEKIALGIKQDKAKQTKDQNSLSSLQDALEKLREENRSLTQKLSQAPEPSVSKVENADIKTLKTQNERLRDTIKAQTDLLARTDNAAQKAEALLSENAALKNQLKHANNATNSNDTATKELLTRNQKMVTQLKKQEQRIAQLEGLTETVKQLRMENDRIRAGQLVVKNANEQITTLQEKNNALQADLNKQKEAASAYRVEISKYQNEIKTLHADIKRDEIKESENQITALRLENHELKARIELLNAKQKKSVVFKSETGTSDTNTQTETLLQETVIEQPVQYTKAKETEISQSEYETEGIKLIETAYPKVDKVLPILNAEGKHIYEKVKTSALPEDGATKTANGALKAEDLLSQDLKPLSD